MKHLKMLVGIPPNFGTKKEQTPWLLPFFFPDIDPLKLSLTIPQDHARGARGLEDNFTTGKGDSQRVYGQLGKVVMANYPPVMTNIAMERSIMLLMEKLTISMAIK